MRRLVLALVLFLGATPLAHAQISDTVGPTLDVTLSGFFAEGLRTNSVDVTGGPATLKFRLRLSDNLSGVTFTEHYFGVAVTVVSPTFFRYRYIQPYAFALVDGTEMEGTWEADFVMPQYSPDGEWQIESIFVMDRAGNSTYLDMTTLQGLGLDTSLMVTSVPDLTPPVLTVLEIVPPNPDTSADSVMVQFRMRITDDVSGVDLSNANLGFNWPVLVTSPIGNFARVCSEPVRQDEPDPITGDPGSPLNDVWVSDCWFPRYSQEGFWPIQINVADAAGNTTQYFGPGFPWQNPPEGNLPPGSPDGIHLTSTPSDVTDPTLSSITISPTFIDTSVGPQDLTLTANMTDDISGFSGVDMTFTSPSGGQTGRLFAFNVTAGDRLSGTVSGTVTFPQYREAGTWRATGLFYYDQTFNYVSVSGTANIAALGFPTVINIVRPSLEADGDPIGSGGGTVEDEVFGDRAQVTLPAGAVSQDTEVAIDVLESELEIDMPTGFSAPGTRFVNFHFDPYPAMPLPAPGATIVLPLINPMIPGTPLTLYRLNPTTGALEPAEHVSGGAVVGHVNPDTVSATFTGVARLSVVVALTTDTEAPVVTPPAGISIHATESGGARGSASSVLSAFLAGGTATDNVDLSPERLAPQVNGSDVSDATLFPVGDTMVHFRFKDTAGNIGSAAAVVTVRSAADTEPPDVTAPGSITVEATQSGGASGSTSASLSAFLAGGTAVDNVDPSPVKLTPQVNGSDVDNTTLFTLGATTVTFRFRDASNNIGTATATATVVDTTRPTVTAPASITVAATEATGARGSASAALAAFLAAGSASDVADPSPARLAPRVAGADVDNTTLFGVGTTTVTFRFQDAAGNIGTASATVTVRVGTPSLAIRIVGKSAPSPAERVIRLRITNAGTGHARAVTLRGLAFRTLAGSGAVSLASPALPIVIPSLDAGTSTEIEVMLAVPTTVQRFSMTESGTLADVTGRMFRFSLAQAIIP